MKQSIIILLIIISIGSCKEENEVILSRHDNGRVHEKISYKLPITNDSIGIKTLLYENGKLHCEGGYKNRERHGKWKCFNRKGGLKWEASYVNGKENGEVYCRYENGAWEKITTVNGVKTGKTVEYKFDSTKNNFYYVYGQYENDLETGVWTWRDTNQQIIKEVNFDKGVNVGYFAFYYPNGNIKMKGFGFKKEDEEFIRMKDTLFHYNQMENGKIDSLEIYKDGRLQMTIKNIN